MKLGLAWCVQGAILTFLTPSPDLFYNLQQISCLEMDQWFSFT